MFSRAAITLGIGPHSSYMFFLPEVSVSLQRKLYLKVVVFCDYMLQSKMMLQDGIDKFIEEKILLAAKAISEDACCKICDGDVILVYSRLLLVSYCLVFVTLPVRVVAKYCDECVCLCLPMSVCLSDRISPEPHARCLPNFFCMLPMAVARFSSSMLTIGRIAYRQEGFSSPLTMHCKQ